jgi:hypothetical protein
MLFDPDDGQTWAQKIESVLSRDPTMRARVVAVAQATDRSVQEVVEACAHLWLDDMEDPAYRAAEHAAMDRKEAPYGFDPLMRRDGAR